MYQGKHYKKSRRRSRKSAALLVSLLLLLTVTVGGTIAFLMDSDGPLHNMFNPSQVTTNVVETLEGMTKKDVKIQNTGDTDAWIRAAVVITWQDKDGNVYGQKPVAGTDKDYTIYYEVSQEIKADCWVEGKDGFYYWTSPVAAKNGETGVLIDSCTTDKSITVGTGEEAVTYYLTVEIIGSGIQSKPDNVFNTEWASSGLTVKTIDLQGNELPPEQWTLVSKEVQK